MISQNSGTNNVDDAVICEECGAPLAASGPAVTSETSYVPAHVAADPAPARKTKGWAIALAVVLSLVAALFVWALVYTTFNGRMQERVMSFAEYNSGPLVVVYQILAVLAYAMEVAAPTYLAVHMWLFATNHGGYARADKPGARLGKNAIIAVVAFVLSRFILFGLL